MDKKQELLKIKQDLQRRKDIPLIKSANDVVFGDGNPDAIIMLIGEAAGYYESIEHKPFVGVSGKMLVKTMEEILGLKREDVYISNIVKARPPNNRDPTPEEIEAFKPYLDREIQIIQPKVIMTLGRFSMSKFIPGVTISRIHGEPKNLGPYIIFPMFHPAAALRGTTTMNLFKADFVKLKSLLDQSKAAIIEETSKKVEPAQTSLF